VEDSGGGGQQGARGGSDSSSLANAWWSSPPFNFFRFLRFLLSRGSSSSSNASAVLRFFFFFFSFFAITTSSSSSSPSRSSSFMFCRFPVSLVDVCSPPPSPHPFSESSSRALWNGPVTAFVPSFSLRSRFSKSRFCRHAMPLGSFWCCIPMPSMSSFCVALIALMRPSPDAPRPLDASHPNFER